MIGLIGATDLEQRSGKQLIDTYSKRSMSLIKSVGFHFVFVKHALRVLPYNQAQELAQLTDAAVFVFTVRLVDSYDFVADYRLFLTDLEASKAESIVCSSQITFNPLNLANNLWKKQRRV